MNRQPLWFHVVQARSGVSGGRDGGPRRSGSALGDSDSCSAALAFLHFALTPEEKLLLRDAVASGSGNEAYRLTGSAVKALLCTWGFTAERLGVESLDAVWPELVREAVSG